jgi:hypothetical protein
MGINAMRWPDKDQWDIVFKGIQAIGIFVGAIWIAYTYFDTRTRELRKPYDEKQLSFYADAVQVVAHLATVAEDDKAKDTITRFWELYWGELPLVESNEVRTRMNDFCKNRFPASEAHPDLCGEINKATTDTRLNYAIAISDQAKCEVRERWEGEVGTLAQVIRIIIPDGRRQPAGCSHVPQRTSSSASSAGN